MNCKFVRLEWLHNACLQLIATDFLAISFDANAIGFEIYIAIY